MIFSNIWLLKMKIIDYIKYYSFINKYLIYIYIKKVLNSFRLYLMHNFKIIAKYFYVIFLQVYTFYQ